MTRHLDWDGCHNVRDLGGIPLPGGETRRGAIIRSDTPDRLTAAGWSAAREYGVRTMIDLRSPGEHRVGDGYRPPWLTVVPVQLHDLRKTGIPQFYGTPLYYRPLMERDPKPFAAVFQAIASAEPDGVVVHCVAGRDRTGMISMLLLALAGVAPHDIADDYELSTTRLTPLFAKLGEADEGPIIEQALAEQNTTIREAAIGALDGLDVEDYLLAGGLSRADLEAVRARLR